MPHIKAMQHIISKDPPVLIGFSESLTHFITCCLQKDPKERYSAKKLLDHNFMKLADGGKSKFVSMMRKMKKDSPLPI